MENIRKLVLPIMKEQIVWLELSLLYYDYYKGKNPKYDKELDDIQKEALKQWMKEYNVTEIPQDKLLIW